MPPWDTEERPILAEHAYRVSAKCGEVPTLYTAHAFESSETSVSSRL